MNSEPSPLQAEQRFFAALIRADINGLGAILGEDFLLIDVMTGSEINKSALLAVVESGQLKFDAMGQIESRLRMYGETAVVTGRTQMSGQFEGRPFAASSRYTHVYVKAQSQWLLVSAQGTQIAGE
jgi:ketosteroid isomerase-like protein